MGFLVGLTGSGGGALTTPMLVLVFSVKPSIAIASDLVASLVMRPVGAAVHLARGNVNLRLVTWLAAGSVPAAFAGACVLQLLGHTNAAEGDLRIALGAALLLGSGGMILRYALDRQAPAAQVGTCELPVRPVPTLAIGAVGGFVVGATSVGAGSLMVVLLVLTYSGLTSDQLVGTDLVQAVPLTAAAALGALLFGGVSLALTSAVVLGALPAVALGSTLSSQVPDRIVRPAVATVVLASGLAYVGLPVAGVGWVAISILVAAAAARSWSARRPPARRREDEKGTRALTAGGVPPRRPR